jgi:hypothetical protein
MTGDRSVRRLKWKGARYLVQRNHSVDFDDAVEPTKEDRDGPQQDVHWISDEMSDKLDELGEQHPNEKSPEGECCLFDRPFACADPQQPDKCHVTKKGWRGQCGEMDCISAPWLSPASHTKC